MLCSYRGVTQPVGFLIGISQDSLALGRKWQIDRCWYFFAGGDLLFDLFANRYGGCAGNERVQQDGILAKQAQQQVIGFNCGAAKRRGFVSSKENHSPRVFRVSLKHEGLLLRSRMTPTCRGKQIPLLRELPS